MKEIMCNLAGFIYEHNLYFVEDGIVQSSKPVKQEDMAFEILKYVKEFDTYTVHLFGVKDFVDKFKDEIEGILNQTDNFNFSFQDLKFIYN